MTSGFYFLLYLTSQRLAELAIARRNTRRLIARGGKERGAAHYPLMVAFHALWLAVMWAIGWDAEIGAVWGLLFAVLQGLRLWMLLSLGARWTTRIIIIDEQPIRRGPYRFMKHPNYAIVVGEIAVVPLALGAPWLALAASLAHLGVLAIRLRAENAALAEFQA